MSSADWCQSSGIAPSLSLPSSNAPAAAAPPRTAPASRVSASSACAKVDLMWSAIEDRSASPCLNAPSAVAPGLVCMRRLTFSSDGCGMLYPQNTTSALQGNTGREQSNSRGLPQKDMPWPVLHSLAEDSLAHDRIAEAVAERVVLLGNHQRCRGIRGARDLQTAKHGNAYQYSFRIPRPCTRTACRCTVAVRSPFGPALSKSIVRYSRSQPLGPSA